MKLVIAEKPSVGAAIAAVMGANEKRSGYFEGGGYLVSWCIGHLISLADAATYNEQFRKWKYDDLPIVPQEWQFIVASGKEQQFSGHLLHRFRRHFRQKDPCNHKEGSDESRRPRILGKEYHAPERRKKRIDRTEEPCVLSRHVLLRDRLERKAEARAEEDERQKVQDRAPLLRHRNRTDRNGRDGAEKAHETHLPYADGKRVERFHILCCQENEECIAERRQKTVNDARRNVRPTAF